MVVSKNQIRPRRKKFHFTNAEILLLDTTGFIRLVPPAPLNQSLCILDLQVKTNIAVVYAGDDAAAFIEFADDYSNTFAIENDGVNILAFKNLFTQTGINLWSGLQPFGFVDSFGEVTYPEVFNWTDAADLHTNGGIFLTFDNGGADLTGGDVANSMDIFVSYSIVNL